MKSLFTYLLVSIFALPIAAHACPNLAGDYWCLIEDGHREPWLEVLTIKQSIDPNSPTITNFTSTYRSIPGVDETFSADSTGIEDGWGWIIKCTADRLVSVRDDYSALSELYLDKEDNLVRTYNYKVQETCSRKN